MATELTPLQKIAACQRKVNETFPDMAADGTMHPVKRWILEVLAVHAHLEKNPAGFRVTVEVTAMHRAQTNALYELLFPEQENTDGN